MNDTQLKMEKTLQQIIHMRQVKKFGGYVRNVLTPIMLKYLKELLKINPEDVLLVQVE